MLSHFQFEADVRKIKDQVVKIDILELNPTKYVQKLMEINQWDSNEIYVFGYGDKLSYRQLLFGIQSINLIFMSFYTN